MLFVQETHAVVGTKEEEFEAAYRDGWMPLLAGGDDARLLWYFHLAHGSGLSYRVVTYTAVRDGAAYERLAARAKEGDVRDWLAATDDCRHHVDAQIFTSLDFSPFEVDLASVPTEPQSHEPAMYMEDTMWPRPGKFPDYQRAAASVYSPMLTGRSEGERLLTVEAALQTVPGGGRYPAVTLLQRIWSLDLLSHLLSSDMPAEMSEPGQWMHDALEYRDQWRSRLLRSAEWSPLP